MQTKMQKCPCGCAKLHKMASRKTSDEIVVLLWSDGSITGWVNALRGVPVRRPRSAEAHSLAVKAGWLLMGIVELYSLDELPDLYRACESVARNPQRTVVDEFERLRESKIAFVWETTAADRDGRWTEQTARLDRMRWPNIVILRTRTRSGYELFYEESELQLSGDEPRRMVREVIHKPSGFRCGNLRDLCAHLMSLSKLPGGVRHVDA